MLKWLFGEGESAAEIREIRAQQENDERARRFAAMPGVDISFLIKYLEENEILDAHNRDKFGEFLPSYYGKDLKTLRFKTHDITLQTLSDDYGYTATERYIMVSRRDQDPQMDLFDTPSADTLKFVGQLKDAEIKPPQLKRVIAFFEAKYSEVITAKANAELNNRVTKIKEDLNDVY